MKNKRKLKIGDRVQSTAADPSKIGIIVLVDGKKYPAIFKDEPRPFLVNFSTDGSNWGFFKEDELRLVRLKSEKKNPYTLILKSGIKIGISEEMSGNLINDIQGKVSECDYFGNEFYRITEIAAIVPSENVLK